MAYRILLLILLRAAPQAALIPVTKRHVISDPRKACSEIDEKEPSQQYGSAARREDNVWI